MGWAVSTTFMATTDQALVTRNNGLRDVATPRVYLSAQALDGPGDLGADSIGRVEIVVTVLNRLGLTGPPDRILRGKASYSARMRGGG